jgi:hypothetical protein
MEADFSGWATKSGIKCSDGRTIMPDAFKHQDSVKVPLVWNHGHDSVDNILGHAILENRAEGVYMHAYFNDSPQGQTAKKLVQHGDINSLSIFANGLVEKAKNVIHGMIREVSLVLAGANIGAVIDNVSLAHADGSSTILEDEAVIYTGLEFELGDGETVEHAAAAPAKADTDDDDDDTVQDVWDSLDQKQKAVMTALLAEAAGEDVATDADGDKETPQEEAAESPKEEKSEAKADAKADAKVPAKTSVKHSEDGGSNEENDDEGNSADNVIKHNDPKGNKMGNLFEQGDEAGKVLTHSSLTKDQTKTIFADAMKNGSLKEAVLAHADDYGIQDVETFFPEAKLTGQNPQFLQRRNAWVAQVLGAVSKSPFSRIKSLVADITADEARAKGYVRGNQKKDEIIKALKRVTTPTTVYKKQKLDRDDILDITDFSVVAFIQAEMRVMLDEEVAAALLFGDGRASDDEDKIDEEKLRPVAYDIDMYNTTLTAPASTGDSSKDAIALVDFVVEAQRYFRGTGSPTMYTTLQNLTRLLIQKDTLGRRIYANKDELVSALMVADIVPVEAMERASNIQYILVNLTDYTVGADQGGAVSMFDFFDIDFNQQKYLIETRVSGALTKPKAAITILAPAGTAVTPTSPSFDGATNTITIPTVTGVDYFVGSDILGGQPTTGTVVITENTDIEARPQAGYSFPQDTIQSWTFTYTAPAES